MFGRIATKQEQFIYGGKNHIIY